MKSCLPLLGACCLAACSAAAAPAAPPTAETRENPRDMSMKTLTLTAQYAPHWEKGTEQRFLNVEFKNTGKETIRLLDKLTPKLMRCLFFTIEIWNEQGKNVVYSHASSDVDFYQPIPYKEIEPGKSYSVTVPLDERIRDANGVLGKSGNYKLPPGRYKLELTYLNRYGWNCVKGEFKAPPVSFTVE
jgi:hypothetical protein